MPREAGSLQGKTLLLVEDEYLIAMDMIAALEELGAEVAGPARSVATAVDLIEEFDGRLSGAVLDINLGPERVFPVADILASQGIPFIFATGYDDSVVPSPYGQVPRCEKPVDRALLSRMLQAILMPGTTPDRPTK